MNKFQEWCKEAYPFVVAGMNGEKVEYSDGSGLWVEKTSQGLYFAENEYRIAPNTIKVNGHDVPAPETNSLTKGTEYYVASVFQDGFVLKFRWDSGSVDLRMLKRGLVHLTEEAAIAHAKAMLGVGGSK